MSEAVKSVISIAGSARKPIIISRRAPSVPKDVPMSIAGERHEHAREREETDQRDHVRGGRERQIGREHRHDAHREPHAAEEHVRRRAKERRGVVREHRVLVKELVQHPVRLQDARAAPVLQPRAALVDPAQHERRDQHDQHRLQHLEDDAAGVGHCANTSSAISVMKLYSR